MQKRNASRNLMLLALTMFAVLLICGVAKAQIWYLVNIEDSNENPIEGIAEDEVTVTVNYIDPVTLEPEIWGGIFCAEDDPGTYISVDPFDFTFDDVVSWEVMIWNGNIIGVTPPVIDPLVGLGGETSIVYLTFSYSHLS